MSMLPAVSVAAAPAPLTPGPTASPTTGMLSGSTPRSLAGPLPGPTPISYDYDVTLDPASRSLTGHGRVVVRNDQTAPLDEVYLRVWTEAADLTRHGASGAVTHVSVDGRDAAGASQDRTVVKVPLATPLAHGATAIVDFDVAVAVAKTMDRTGTNSDGTLYFGNALPTLAVRDDEGWNLDPYVEGGESFYSLSSDWNVRLHAPQAKQLITTGTLDGDGTVTGGMRDVTAHVRHARDFIVVAAEGYDQLTRKVGDTTVRVWAPKNEAATGRSMLDTAASSIAYFNARYGTYDQPEMDVVAARGLGGGMEYPGVALDDTRSSASFLKEVVAHENAHQWFYSMVGNNEFDDPWLDESFATYITSEYLHQPVATTAAHLATALHGAHPARPEGIASASEPIHVSSPMSVLYHHGYVDEIYTTGANVLGKLHDELGETAWLDGMRSWFASQHGGVATTDGYMATMSRAAGRDLTPWFERRGVFASEPAADRKLDPNADF